MPLVELGLVNLIPDPCDFDFHLRDQMMMMARARSPRFDPKDDPRLQKAMEEDNRRSIMLMPPDAMRRRLREPCRTWMRMRWRRPCAPACG